jgi:putative ABC transport system ATP-binding protein
MLEAINISKDYGSGNESFRALNNVTLQVNDGECVAIVGKSGSGKSTLMHLLACLDKPSRGKILLDEQDVNLLNEKQQDRLRNEKFGFIFQQFFLNGRETVLENVILPLKIRGASNYRMVRYAMDALEAVGLASKEQNKAKDLSGGEKQRVCIARALVSQPSIIFADEPTGNLDSVSSEIIENLLFDLNKQKGMTLIIVTHDIDLANKCQRIIELKDGEIVSERAGKKPRRRKPKAALKKTEEAAKETPSPIVEEIPAVNNDEPNVVENPVVVDSIAK